MKNRNKSLKGKNVVSLDVTETSIRVVSGKRMKEGIRVQKAFILTLPEGCYKDGVIANYELISGTLKEGIKAHGITSGYFGICTVDIKDVISRVMTLPVVKPNHLINMINLEMQQHLPIDLSNFILQYKIQDTYTEEGVSYHEVLVVAAPRDIVNDMQRLMTDAGLKPAAVDWKPNSANKLLRDRVINGSISVKEKTLALVNIHQDHSSFTIISNGKNKYNRVFPIGNSELFHAMNKESVHELIDLDQVNNADFIDSLNVHLDESSIQAWMDELERILKFYSSREAGNKVDSVMIYGNYKGLESLPKAIEEYLLIPASFIESVNKIYLHKHMEQIKESQYVSALGAMISDYKFGMLSDLNFIEPFMHRAKRIDYASIVATLLILGVIGYAGFDFYLNLSEKLEMEKQLESLEKQMEEQAIQERLDILAAQHAEYEALAAFNENVTLIDLFIKSQYAINKIYYYTFIRSIPESVDVDAISFTKGKIDCTGTASGDLEIAEFQKRLRTTGLFEDITIPSIEYNETTDVYMFSVKLLVKGAENLESH